MPTAPSASAAPSREPIRRAPIIVMTTMPPMTSCSGESASSTISGSNSSTSGSVAMVATMAIVRT